MSAPLIRDQKRLLAVLPAAERERLDRHLEPVSMALGKVTEAAGKLQSAGFIEYSRGRITVVDRPGLEARACECYDVVKRESDRLLPNMTAT
jgi:hypothetical protein